MISVLQACLKEFELLSDPYLPNERHLSSPSEMIEQIKTALGSDSGSGCNHQWVTEVEPAEGYEESNAWWTMVGPIGFSSAAPSFVVFCAFCGEIPPVLFECV